MVQDLGPSRQTRTYGLAHGRFTPPRPMLAVDEESARLVYTDSQMLVRRVDLDWLTTPAVDAVDTTPPHVTSLGGSARATAGALSAQWAFSDASNESPFVPSGVQDYDLRYQQPVVLAPVRDTDWIATDATSHLTQTTAPLPSTIGRDTCWSVRARDHAGNTSDWTAPRCTTADASGPAVRMTAPTALATTSTAALVAYSRLRLRRRGLVRRALPSRDLRWVVRGPRRRSQRHCRSRTSPSTLPPATSTASRSGAGTGWATSRRGRRSTASPRSSTTARSRWARPPGPVRVPRSSTGRRSRRPAPLG